MIKHLPNALTVARFILAPIVAYALYIALSLPLDAASEPLTYPDRLAEAEGWGGWWLIQVSPLEVLHTSASHPPMCEGPRHGRSLVCIPKRRSTKICVPKRRSTKMAAGSPETSPFAESAAHDRRR